LSKFCYNGIEDNSRITLRIPYTFGRPFSKSGWFYINTIEITIRLASFLDDDQEKVIPSISRVIPPRASSLPPYALAFYIAFQPTSNPSTLADITIDNLVEHYNGDLHQLTANTIRGLAMDAVQKANSGHPGMPMGMADVALVLWKKFLKFDSKNPDGADRDRFVLSAGHGSMLIYSLLHLAGYDMTLDDIKDFRQWGSKTPGHPENFETVGVEVTTGPLGQGISTAVGLALSEKHLGARFNKEGHEVVDHHTYVIASDGDLMEGVAYEACSIAGHWKLGKLIVLYDDNGITIDGSIDLAFSEDVRKSYCRCKGRN